jgi:hypothetical protein
MIFRDIPIAPIKAANGKYPLYPRSRKGSEKGKKSKVNYYFHMILP